MSRITRADSFYSRWARLYAVLARYTPGISRLRRHCIEQLDLKSGSVVADMGAGPGPNLPRLHSHVSPDGSVVGIDVAQGQLTHAAKFIHSSGWSNVHLVRGDATNPPLRSADALFASFVIGMFETPPDVIDRWCDIVGSGGRIGLLHFAKSDRWYGFVPNAFLTLLVWLSTPGTPLIDRGSTDLLDERVHAGHTRLMERCQETTVSTHWGGIVHLYTGVIE